MLMADSSALVALSATDAGSVMSFETVGTELSLPQKDLMNELIADEKEYDKRIEMVGEILNTDLPTIVKRSKGVVMPTGFKENGTTCTCKLLPPSAKFSRVVCQFCGGTVSCTRLDRASNPQISSHWKWASCLLDPRSRLVSTTRLQGVCD